MDKGALLPLLLFLLASCDDFRHPDLIMVCEKFIKEELATPATYSRAKVEVADWPLKFANREEREAAQRRRAEGLRKVFILRHRQPIRHADPPVGLAHVSSQRWEMPGSDGLRALMGAAR